jgi:hypothetical protein
MQRHQLASRATSDANPIKNAGSALAAYGKPY